MEVATIPENNSSQPSPQSENKTAFEMLINNLKKKLPNISNVQAHCLVSLLKDLDDLGDGQHIPVHGLRNPQLENILIQLITKQTQIPLITVVMNFISAKLKKNLFSSF